MASDNLNLSILSALFLIMFVVVPLLSGCGGGSSSPSDLSATAIDLPPQTPASPIGFDHTAAFEQLPEDSNNFHENLLSQAAYKINYNFAKYVGYQYLLSKYNRHLPAGRGLTILQAENMHTPDSAGSVLHLLSNPGSDRHSETVASILTETSSWQASWTIYQTFSLHLDSFHAVTTPDLGTITRNLGNGQSYPATSYDGQALSPAKLLNVSNSNGSGTGTVRQFDKFIEENDLVACTAMSGRADGNDTSSGNAYNSIVIHHTQAHPSMFEGATINDHGEPRYKPDLVTWSAIPRATSWSAPTVCSAAAMLLERTQVDSNVASAYNSVVIKAILMAGATRFNYRISTHWTSEQEVERDDHLSEPLFYWGEWERTSDTLPTSPIHGSGAMNVLASYEILDAGEFDPGVYLIGESGWDYARGHETGETLEYRISVEEETMFSVVLVWHRYIDDAFLSYLPDYNLSILDDEDRRLAFSDSLTSNTEMIEAKLQSGDYRIVIRVKSDGGSTKELSYGLAWISKQVLPAPMNVELASESETGWTIAWDEEPGSKYRVSVGEDVGFSEIDLEVFVDGGRYRYSIPDDGAMRYFRVYRYPRDPVVAYQYPSEAVTIVSPVQETRSGEDQDSD